MHVRIFAIAVKDDATRCSALELTGAILRIYTIPLSERRTISFGVRRKYWRRAWGEIILQMDAKKHVFEFFHVPKISECGAVVEISQAIKFKLAISASIQFASIIFSDNERNFDFYFWCVKCGPRAGKKNGHGQFRDTERSYRCGKPFGNIF